MSSASFTASTDFGPCTATSEVLSVVSSIFTFADPTCFFIHSRFFSRLEALTTRNEASPSASS